MRSATPSSALVLLAVTLSALAVGCSESTKPIVPASVLLVSGSGQRGLVFQPLPESLLVMVVDSSGRGVPGTAVVWTVTQGGGRVAHGAAPDSSGSPSATLWTTTNDSGRAWVTWTLGTGGPNSVAASAEGLGTVSFTASAYIVARALSVGYNFACALTESSDTFCWGLNYHGELGNGVIGTSIGTTPTLVAGGLRFSSISAGGGGFACGLTSTGAAYCWGSNRHGTLGIGSTTGPQQCEHDEACSSTPVAVVGGLAFRSISAGYFHACGVTTDGAAYCWGEPTWDTPHPTPTRVAGGISFSSLSVGYRKACGISIGGAAYCWSPVVLDSSAPVPVSTTVSFASITTAYDHTCGIATGGLAYCWGGNGFGQLGNGTTTSAYATPTPVAGSLNFAALSATWYHTCGIAVGGVAYCWGRDEMGELGDGWVDPWAPDSVLTPTRVSGDLSFVSVSTNVDDTCGLTASGAAYCWGWNRFGQVGDGTVTNRSVPTRVTFF